MADFHADLTNLVSQRNYPCIAAVQSMAKRDYDVVEAQAFGSGRSRTPVREAILKFLEKWSANRSTTYALWITYPEDTISCEHEFEARMWAELSSLTSLEERDGDWSPKWSKDPADPRFTLCIGGFAFFVVGLHPKASREGRKFPYPALIFNVYDQFEDLMAQNAYVPMVQKNRERDVKFSGSVNPMAEKHGDNFETIQFSGKTNGDDWKCPFKFK